MKRLRSCWQAIAKKPDVVFGVVVVSEDDPLGNRRSELNGLDEIGAFPLSWESKGV